MRREEPSEVGTARRNWIQPKLSTLYSLKTHTRTHAVLDPRCPRLTPMQRLPFDCHSPHPHDAYFILATPYIHAMIVSGITQLILSTARCICQQHPPGSSQVNILQDGLESYTGHTFGRVFHSSAQIQSVYSTAQSTELIIIWFRVILKILSK